MLPRRGMPVPPSPVGTNRRNRTETDDRAAWRRYTDSRFHAATIAPATAGPKSRVAFIAAFDMAIALITFWGPTTWAISGLRAGMPSAMAVPPPRPTTNSQPMVIVPVNSITAVATAKNAVADCEAMVRLRFSKRSASEPPTSENSSMGSPNESEMRPTAP